MRRTDEEFKAEVFRRSEAWRVRRSKRRRMIVAVCLPVLLCSPVLAMLLTGGFGGTTESANMTADMSMRVECVEAPAAAAPEEAYIPEAQEAEQDGVESNGAGSCFAAVLSIEVISQPESPDYARTFSDTQEIAAIMDAIQAFFDDPDTVIGGDEVGDCEGMSYRITVTEETIIREYILFNNALANDGVWYINPECYRALEELIGREGD